MLSVQATMLWGARREIKSPRAWPKEHSLNVAIGGDETLLEVGCNISTAYGSLAGPPLHFLSCAVLKHWVIGGFPDHLTDLAATEVGDVHVVGGSKGVRQDAGGGAGVRKLLRIRDLTPKFDQELLHGSGGFHRAPELLRRLGVGTWAVEYTLES